MKLHLFEGTYKVALTGGLVLYTALSQ